MSSKEFRILPDSRLLFICPSCKKRTVYNVLNIQRNTYKCQRCGFSTRTMFNRRPVALKTKQGKEIQVRLREISPRGAIFQLLNDKDSQFIKIGGEVRLLCKWNPNLVPRSKYLVQSNDENWIVVKKF